MSACGGKSNSDAQHSPAGMTGGTSAITGSGGATSAELTTNDATQSTGGASMLTGSGGAYTGTLVGIGGVAAGTGAATSTYAATGGAYGSTLGGSGGMVPVTGGAGAAGYGGVVGSGGDVVSAGSSATLNCGSVTCPSIPTSCKKLVQDPSACCPTCLDTGCGTCAPLTCDAGTHSDVVTGDCCPSCVDDPPDPCTVGQKAYQSVRQSMLEKYSYGGCSNSSDCTLVLEDNSCVYACNVPLPTSTAHYLTDSPTTLCSTCPAPTRVTCEPQVPACVNKKCVAVAAP